MAKTLKRAKPRTTPRRPRTDGRLIARAASVLRALADQSSGLSLGQIAKETGLPRATVQRIVNALAAERFVVVGELVPGVRLGAEIARIAGAVHRNVVALCRPAIEQLNAEVGDTVDLTILQGGAAIVIDQVPTARPLRVVSHIGTPLPVHCTASGKAHLRQLTREQAISVIPLPLRRYTKNTIMNIERILNFTMPEVDDDIFFDDEEFADGVSAVATPIRGLTSGNYAIAVSLPKQYFEDRRALICEALKRCYEAIVLAAGIKTRQDLRKRRER